MTNVKKLYKLSVVHDGYATLLWLMVSIMLAAFVMWLSHSTFYLFDWLVFAIIVGFFFVPVGVLLLVLHIYHRHRISDILHHACSDELFNQEVFHVVGKDLAMSDHFLIYVAKMPVIVRRMDVQGVHLMPNKIVLSTANGPFAYLNPDDEIIHSVEEWAHAQWVCPNCGAEMDASYIFCTNCGYHREVAVEETKKDHRRSFLVIALVVLLVMALVLVYCGMEKPVERRMELEPDGYLAVACEQMMNNG